MSDTERTIAEAEGLAFLGLYVESWEAVETLPSSVRLFPEVLAVRLLICAGLPRPLNPDLNLWIIHQP